MDQQDEQQQREQTLAEQIARAQEIADFRWLMNDPRGRRFMWRSMGRCRVFQPSIGPTDAATNFNEGQRNVGLFLLGEINELCPALFSVMAAENAQQPVEEPPMNYAQEADQ
ncbi:Bbp19 family protein [Pseudomonas sp. Au-Pse12]|uniref:Bbp19 family protein n=1 Tax=Pseudomonas sp. Au-Pse12 TaxID=2906459 RepID=UPI001E47DF26|nr:hypothetical protein [Pseudomonas sp. Au-Pse12]MCE4056303.1 hypothetical protein [Pseudomonas sp. Au-Pse12]